MGGFKTLGKAWKVPDIRKKMIFTLLMLLVFRIGSNIPIPGINREVLANMFQGDNSLFSLFDMFSGGAFSNMTIFALSITPYITASIIFQLLTISIPAIERLAKEGMEGRKKIAQYTRYLTVLLAFIQAVGLALGLFRKALVSTDFFSVAVVVLVLSAGTAFLMWLGEQINQYGLGNGISLVIFGGIIARLPHGIREAMIKYGEGTISSMTIILFTLVVSLFSLFSIHSLNAASTSLEIPLSIRLSNCHLELVSDLSVCKCHSISVLRIILKQRVCPSGTFAVLIGTIRHRRCGCSPD